MIKKITLLLTCLLTFSIGFTQTLPIDFESAITTADFVNFDGGTATVIANPESGGINTSATVAQIVRDGGEIWGGSKLILASNLDLSMGLISMKVFTTAPIGTTVKFKLEGGGATELDAVTTVSGEWETLTWDFTGQASNFNEVVFMFDFGNVGNGSATSTFLFDDVEQTQGLAQIDLPVDFEGSITNYTTTDFGGNISSLVPDPTNASNNVIRAVKTDQAATWAGTTIGTPSGFATNIPLTLSDSKMTVRVWATDAGIPIRLKVENSGDPTQTCETETLTTAAGWQTLEFDFTNQAPGTESLSVGLSMGWIYSMASIFFNFGTEGQTAGEQTYYFDDVRFGGLPLSIEDNEIEGLKTFPNPTSNQWTITVENKEIASVELFDLSGQLIRVLYPNTNTVQIDVSDFVNGIYVSKISTDSETAYVRFVKSR